MISLYSHREHHEHHEEFLFILDESSDAAADPVKVSPNVLMLGITSFRWKAARIESDHVALLLVPNERASLCRLHINF